MTPARDVSPLVLQLLEIGFVDQSPRSLPGQRTSRVTRHLFLHWSTYGLCEEFTRLARD